MKHKTQPLLFAALLTAAALPSFAGQPVTIEDDKKEVAPVEAQEDYVRPISDPYFNEDSSVTTDIRLWYVYQAIPASQPLGKGHAEVGAAEVRIALTHYLEFLANKDGYTWIDTPGYKKDGWNNIAAALKWQVVNQKAIGLTAAVGVGYEFATGDQKSLQDYDEVRFWLSVDKQFGKFHVGANGGFHHGCGNGEPVFPTSDFVDWHIHFDYNVCKYLSPVFEINGYHTTSNGTPTTPFSGMDVANISGNTDANVITAAVGAEVRPIKNLGIRLAWEKAISDKVDLIDYRWTASAVYKFW